MYIDLLTISEDEVKKFHIENEDISDGYHTFDELYDHRNLLWVNFCLVKSDDCYWVKEHFEGWDLLLMRLPYGQISYHVPTTCRFMYEDRISECPVENHIFDGHASTDVLKRLAGMAARSQFNKGSD